MLHIDHRSVSSSVSKRLEKIVLMKTVCHAVQLRAYHQLNPAKRYVDNSASKDSETKRFQNRGIVEIDSSNVIRQPPPRSLVHGGRKSIVYTEIVEERREKRGDAPQKRRNIGCAKIEIKKPFSIEEISPKKNTQCNYSGFSVFKKKYVIFSTWKKHPSGNISYQWYKTLFKLIKKVNYNGWP